VDPLELAHEVGELFESMAIPWVLGGSLASSMVGEPRSTMDIDMAVRMGLDHVDQLVAAVIDRYYVSADMVREAVIRKSSFNILAPARLHQADAVPSLQWRRRAFVGR
jgi:hypothetical protein